MSETLRYSETIARSIDRVQKKPIDLTRMKHNELAEVLRVQPCTVRYWTRFGCPYEPAGRLRFYNLEAVKAWLREQDEKKRVAKQVKAEVKEAA